MAKNKKRSAPQEFSLKNSQMNHALAAKFVPQTINADKRTIDVVFSAGTKVIRTPFFAEPYYLQLQIDEDSIRLDRLNNGAPLLNTHSKYDLKDQIGVVEKAWVKDGLAYATIRFSKRDEVEPIWQDVLDGIYRGISPGVNIFSWEEMHSDDEKYMTMKATDWEPMELSLCPVQADAKAHTLSDQSSNVTFSGDEEMGKKVAAANDTLSDDSQKPAPAPAPAPVDEAKLRAEGAKAERERSSGIRNAVKAAKLSAEFAEELINDDQLSLDQARAKIIDELAAQDEGTPTRTQNLAVGVEETDNRITGMENALMHRANPGTVELGDNGRRFRGMTLMEMGKACLGAHGVPFEGKPIMEVAKLAMHSTSDFPSILANSAGKAMRKAYESSPQTFRSWTSEGTAPDFKTMSRTQLHGLALEQVVEGAEIQRGTVSDSKEEYALATYGRIIAITRQTIINDDMDAFNRLPRMFGSAAANLESDVVYAILTANAAMADTKALFHADHGNLGTGGAISATTLDEMRSLMRTQTDDKGKPLNIMPAFLIVPAALEGVALRFMATEVEPTQPSEVNTHKGKYGVVVEPRLDNTSILNWYAAANPSQVDTIEYSYLDGQRGLYLEERVGFEVDGIEVKGRLDFAAKAIDWRGLFKNAGS